MRRKALKYLPPVLGLLVLAGAVVGLRGALKKLSLGDILAALEATPREHILHAVLALGASCCIMCAYDLPGVLFARRVAKFPPLGLRRIGLASFCAYSLSHVLGAPAISAAAIRVRLYAQWSVPGPGITRIVALSATNFTLGLASLLGGFLLLWPDAMPVFGNTAPGLLRLAGLVLISIPVAYVTAAHGRSSVRLLGREIALPGSRLAAIQIVLSCADIATTSAVLYAVLPATPGLSYPLVLSLYLAAFASGAYSGLPGGVGVFDSVLLLGLSAYLPTADALGAILLFRVMYFLAPACIGGLCYAAHELWAHTQAPGETK
ncbi:UPF0104 family protein [Acidocella aromatica]|uniref:Uncharacterized membrane protein YbhN (UPF0104 family) n=1 Tax=Acidocella aromatica TaxID=1303579 RepID=A0A840VKM5_9PROT|nr:UPF0104 family protein [Acidocella aromatica]MBB5372131.1 uncharacterized membrane protein YbhN (UPF0104 family) [Acidocella aromatica]